MSRRAVFLDREGTLTDNGGTHIVSHADVRLLPVASGAVRLLKSAQLATVIVTNQSPVSRGMLTLEAAQQLNKEIADRLAVGGGRIDASYLCPHQHGDGCGCRKPRPGLLQAAATDLNLDLGRSFIIGDSLADMVAGLSVGATPVLVLTGNGTTEARALKSRPELLQQCTIVADVLAAARFVLRRVRVEEEQAIPSPPDQTDKATYP